MANRDVVAVGTSAGGFEALRFLVSSLPSDFPAALLVVIHISSLYRSSLDILLSKAGPLPARFAQDGERAIPGHIYLAPPERHLLLDDHVLRLGHGPRENLARPAIDPTFRSLAACCAGRAIGVVLTGSLGDGASGLLALQQSGGITVVQDPADAAFPEMPRRALSRSKPDHVVDLAGLPALLTRLARLPRGKDRAAPDLLKYEIAVARGGHAHMDVIDHMARRSPLACPDCHGVMWEIEDAGQVRYRCHLGHAYTAEVMSIALDENLRRALSSALRALEERISLMEKLRLQAEAAGRSKLAAMWAAKAKEYDQEAQSIRDSIRRVDDLAARAAEHDERAAAE